MTRKRPIAYICGIPKCFLSAFGWIFRHRPPQMQGTNGACVCTDTVTKSPRTTVSTRDKCSPVPLPPALFLTAAVGEVLKWEGFSFCSVTFLSLTT